jgi:hypothetical protein
MSYLVFKLIVKWGSWVIIQVALRLKGNKKKFIKPRKLKKKTEKIKSWKKIDYNI